MIGNNCCTSQETLAMASFPKQEWCGFYDWDTALKEGTIFTCLNLPVYFADKGSSSLDTNGSASGRFSCDDIRTAVSYHIGFG